MFLSSWAPGPWGGQPSGGSPFPARSPGFAAGAMPHTGAMPQPGAMPHTGALPQVGAEPEVLEDLLRQAAMAGIMMGVEMARRGAPEPLGHKAEPPAELLESIRKDMKEEATAAAFYRRLMEETEDPGLKAYARHAMDDEIKHYRMLGRLYRALAGEPYEAAPLRVEYANLHEGYKKALDDELEAAEGYRSTYLKLRDDRIRDIYFELMTDEMEHATRFTYILQALPMHPAPNPHHTESEDEAER